MISKILFFFCLVALAASHDCEFDSYTCELCSYADSYSCNQAIVEHCESISWSSEACQSVSVECPFFDDYNSPCNSWSCLYGSTDDCANEIRYYCSYAYYYDPGCEGYSVDPSPEPVCVDDDNSINYYGSQASGEDYYYGCYWLGSYGMCQDDSYGWLVRHYCPNTCGGCAINGTCQLDDHEALHQYASSLGYGRYVQYCWQAADYVYYYGYGYSNPIYYKALEVLCPCTNQYYYYYYKQDNKGVKPQKASAEEIKEHYLKAQQAKADTAKEQQQRPRAAMPEQPKAEQFKPKHTMEELRAMARERFERFGKPVQQAKRD